MNETAGSVVVVGATGTMGTAITRRLTKAGVPVVAVGRRRQELDDLAATEPLVEPCIADIGEDAASAALASALSGPVRMAVFAAALPVKGSLDVIEPSALATATNIKVAGMVRMVNGVRERLVEGSRLVAVAGSLGLEPNASAAGPGVANAGLFNLMRQLGLLWGPRGVTTHTLAPGPIDSPRLHDLAATAAEERGVSVEEVLETYTGRTSSGRLPPAEEIAWFVASLLAPEAAALHGAVITLDGGVRHGLV